jgi:hypothetical protein
VIEQIMEALYDLAKAGVIAARDLFLALARVLFGWQQPVLRGPPGPVRRGEIVSFKGKRFRIETVRIDRAMNTGYWAVPV